MAILQTIILIFLVLIILGTFIFLSYRFGRKFILIALASLGFYLITGGGIESLLLLIIVSYLEFRKN